jgi:hypothetical protein
MKQLYTRKHPLGAAVSGIILGLVVAAPALAVVSTATPTVIGHVPVVTVAAGGGIKVTDTNNNSVIDVGDQLIVDETAFTFTDPDQDVKSAYVYEWSVAGVVDKTATTGTYTIKASDLGKSISVKAVGRSDPLITDPSDAVPVVVKYVDNAALGITGTPTTLPVATAKTLATVTIEGMTAGKPVVGTDLTVAAKLADGTDALPAQLNYKWQIESAKGSGTFVDIVGATSGTYKPGRTDQLKKIRVDVTLKTP